MYKPLKVSVERAEALAHLCNEIRKDILIAIYNADRSGHPAGSFSIVEPVVVAYNAELADGQPLVRKEDIFILGSGHNVPALYSVLARKGFFDLELLHKHYRQAGGLSGHPKANIPGIETNEGSLGMALPKAVGFAAILAAYALFNHAEVPQEILAE